MSLVAKYIRVGESVLVLKTVSVIAINTKIELKLKTENTFYCITFVFLVNDDLKLNRYCVLY